MWSGPSSVLSLALWSFLAAPSTQKAAKVWSQPSIAMDCETVVTRGRVPVVRVVGMSEWGCKEEEPPQSGSLWVPCSWCELSLFLLPWFLPPRPHRHGYDGQVHSLRNHWHEKKKITKKGVRPQSSFHCTGITFIWSWKANPLGS